MGIAVIAVEGAISDVAAYIGECKEGSCNMKEAFQWAKRLGAKLSKEEAFGIFKDLEEYLDKK